MNPLEKSIQTTFACRQLGLPRCICAALACGLLLLGPASLARAETGLSSELPARIPTKGLGDETRLTWFMDQLDADWRQLLVHRYRCESQIPASDTCDPAGWYQALSQFLGTPEYVDVLWRRRGGLKDPLLALRLERAFPSALQAAFDQDSYLRQVRDPLEDSVAAFRPDVGGILVTRDQVREIMRHDDDRARRRAAFECGSALSQHVTADLLELFKRRNLLAQRFGYKDYSELSLSMEGLTASQMQALEDSLYNATEPAYQNLLERIRRRTGVFQLHGWDLIYGQSLVDARTDSTTRNANAKAWMLFYVAGLGLNPDTLPVDVSFRPEAPYGARMIPVDPPSEVMLVCNPSNGLDALISMFHEYGKGLQEVSIRDPRPSARTLPQTWQETIGNLFGCFAVEGPSLTRGLHLPDSVATRYRQGWKDAHLVSLRSLLMLSRFERLLYTRPGINADSLWRNFTERYLEVEGPEVSLWGSSVPFLNQPFSYSRYLAAEAASAQILATIHARFLRVDGPLAGRYLVDQVLRPAAVKAWPEILKEATGAPLSAEALARLLEEP